MWKSDKVWKIGGFKYKSLQKYVYIQTYRTVHEHLGRAMPPLLFCDSSTDSYEQIYKNDLLMRFIIAVSAAFIFGCRLYLSAALWVIARFRLNYSY